MRGGEGCGAIPRDGLLGVVEEGEEELLDCRLQLPHRGRPRYLHICSSGGQNVEISSEIPNPSNLRGDKKRRGINLKGTEEGAVELADGEAEAGLREASVGEAAAAAAGERSDAVRAAAAAADNEVLEGERGANVAGGVGGHRADAGRHRGSIDQFTVRRRPGRTESATD